MQILAATDFSTRSNRALRQAGLLAQPDNAQLHIVHVVDDDHPDELIRMEKREAERLLDEQMGSMPELRGVQTRRFVVTGDPFDAILKAAADVNADLIVMGSHRKKLLLDIFIGTTIERVVRKGSFPVLMVNNEAQRRYERVIVPMDMSETSVNALRVASSIGLIKDNDATLLHGFWPITKGKIFASEAEQVSLDQYVAAERQRAVDEFATFLVTNDLGSGGWSLRVDEGGAMEVISRAVTEIRPDLLVMGTNARSGLVKAIVGSVTEEALSSLDVDILAVPRKRG